MRRILLLLVLLFTSCSEPNIIQQLKSEARRSDVVWLCDVDTTGSAVRYRSKRMIVTNIAGSQSKVGDLLPASGPAIEPGTKHGEEALVFLSSQSGPLRVSANFILVFHNGRTGV
jgi:hypothetical protein